MYTSRCEIKNICITYMYNHYNIRLSACGENMSCFSLSCVPTIYSDGATYSTLALLSSILWVRSPCLPDWGLKSKSSGTVRRVATCITQGHTHTLTVHQKRVRWHQPKSLGLWWCWTVTIITFTCTFTFSSYYTFTCRTMGFCWGVKWMSLLRWNYTTLQT